MLCYFKKEQQFDCSIRKLIHFNKERCLAKNINCDDTANEDKTNKVSHYHHINKLGSLVIQYWNNK